MAGISFVVHYRRLQSDPQYRTTFEEVEQTVAQGLEDRVHELATAGDLQAALALLRRFRPELYRDRASLEVSGSLDLVDRLREARNRVITLRNENLPTGTTG
jgi:DNA-binding response OmpR family regulator